MLNLWSGTWLVQYSLVLWAYIFILGMWIDTNAFPRPNWNLLVLCTIIIVRWGYNRATFQTVENDLLCIDELPLRAKKLSILLYIRAIYVLLYCFIADFWPPLSVGEQLHRLKELQIFLCIFSIAHDTHAKRSSLLYIISLLVEEVWFWYIPTLYTYSHVSFTTPAS